MSFSRPIQCYHSHADPIWQDSTFKVAVMYIKKGKLMWQSTVFAIVTILNIKTYFACFFQFKY
jgi:hypothetical protein